MKKERTLPNIFRACEEENSFRPTDEVGEEQIKSIVAVALIDLATAEELSKKAPPASGQWNAIYKLYYDVLHTLCEAYVHLDHVKARTHECLFAYLCHKHPELELSWDFFDMIRTKRNGIHYYGRPATYADWKEIQLQMRLYISTLQKAVEAKLKVT